ncbi:hypothetical protein M5K25_026512 [Dendrobium thyrsiflorum]|uniref:CCHC-type domain-containing protein n=1 Tax=Dendrobium thyrsiflorum TaxID=117978 RepID=A0ABD0TY05_DENTH
MNAMELRRLWLNFGKFHFTSLGLGRVLCSFFSKEAMENILSGGPWFVNGHIAGVDKWSSNFSPTTLKGLTSPVWVRLSNLPLYCWDEVNVSRIASLIGTPLLIDGNMFQWGRKEFARVCVRVVLDKQLPLGVWVEGLNGMFFQKVEYEKISSFCFSCGRIGHFVNSCGVDELGGNWDGAMKKTAKEVAVGSSLPKVPNNDSAFGPWIHVNHKKKKWTSAANQKKTFIPKAATTKAYPKVSEMEDFPGGKSVVNEAEVYLSKEVGQSIVNHSGRSGNGEMDALNADHRNYAKEGMDTDAEKILSVPVKSGLSVGNKFEVLEALVGEVGEVDYAVVNNSGDTKIEEGELINPLVNNEAKEDSSTVLGEEGNIGGNVNKDGEGLEIGSLRTFKPKLQKELRCKSSRREQVTPWSLCINFWDFVLTQYLKELDDLRSKLFVTHATAEASAASAQSAQSQCLSLLKELDEKNSCIKENEIRVNSLGEQLDQLQRNLQERELSQKQLKENVLKMENEIQCAVAKAGDIRDCELRKILDEISIRNYEKINKLLIAKDDEISRLRDEIRFLSAQWKHKTKELESQLEKHRRADQELKKKVLKLEFCLQETRSQMRKLQRMGEKRDMALRELREQIALKQQKVENSNVKQNFWESPMFKVFVSMSMLVLVAVARR